MIAAFVTGGVEATSSRDATSRSARCRSGATYNPNGTLATSIQPAGTASFTYLNCYLYAHANPGVMIDPDGHRAEQFDGGGGRPIALANACAAVSAAKKSLSEARSAYLRAGAAVRDARAQLLQLCPLSSCVDQEDRAVWRESRLAAYARAVSARDQAKARYEAAASAYSAAQQQLRSAAAQVSKASKPKAKAMDPPSERSGSAWTRAVAPPPKDEGIGGFLHGALDLVGMIPIIGEPADLLNAGIYAAQGDLVNAGLSAASAIPLAGNVLGVGKLALKYGDDVVGAVAKTGDDVAESSILANNEDRRRSR